MEDVLIHYGVLGMKWGIRKDGMPQGYQGSGKGRGVSSNVKSGTRAEDIKAVNRDGNVYKKGRSNNCMMCTTAYDLRRRGYDVEAGRTNIGYTDNVLHEWYDNVKIVKTEPVINDGSSKPDHYDPEAAYKAYTKDPTAYEAARAKLQKNTMNALKKQGDGARGNLMFSYDAGGGHSIAYEVHNGEVHLYDTQSGKEVKPSDVFSHASPAAYNSYARLDTAKPKMDFLKENGIIQDRGKKDVKTKMASTERKAIMRKLKDASKISDKKKASAATDKVMKEYGPTKVTKAVSDQIDRERAKATAIAVTAVVAYFTLPMLPALLSKI